MTKPLPFTQAAIKRAMSAVKAVGETVTGVEIRPDGSFSVLTQASGDQQPLSALERWEQENGHRAA
jgi:hypothetical protein